MPTNNDFEKIVADVFSVGKHFVHKQLHHNVLVSGKPIPSKGEGKTDLYLKTIDNNHVEHEIKISIKKDNYEFLENKITASRALEIFGDNALNIISDAASSIRDDFEKSNLVVLNKDASYTILLGWKIELFFNTPRKLKAPIFLSDEQKIDVLCGTNLSETKKNAYVHGVKILNSGVANMLLEVPNDIDLLKSKSINDLASELLSPKEFIEQEGFDINAGFTALNFRSNKWKWDGDRPLAVWVHWSIQDGKLSSSLQLNKPFEKNGNQAGEDLLHLLKTLDFGQKITLEKLKLSTLNPEIIHKIK